MVPGKFGTIVSFAISTVLTALIAVSFAEQTPDVSTLGKIGGAIFVFAVSFGATLTIATALQDKEK